MGSPVGSGVGVAVGGGVGSASCAPVVCICVLTTISANKIRNPKISHVPYLQEILEILWESCGVWVRVWLEAWMKDPVDAPGPLGTASPSANQVRIINCRALTCRPNVERPRVHHPGPLVSAR